MQWWLALHVGTERYIAKFCGKKEARAFFSLLQHVLIDAQLSDAKMFLYKNVDIVESFGYN